MSAYDIDWSSIYGNNSGGSYLGDYSNFSLESSGNESYMDNYETDSWFTDSFASTDKKADSAENYTVDQANKDAADSTWLDDVWGWVNTEVGAKTVAGGIGMLADLWGEEAKAKIAYKNGGGADDGPSAAELQDDRIAAHNESINKPMDMGLVKFKRG